MVYLRNGVLCIVKFKMADEEDDGEEEAIYTTPFFSQVICGNKLKLFALFQCCGLKTFHYGSVSRCNL
jgi:hypothetical protein